MLPPLMGPAHATRGISRKIERAAAFRQLTTSFVALAAPPRHVKVEHSSSSSATPSVSPQETQPASILTWDKYLRLRGRRRWFNFGSSALTTTLAAITSSSYLLTQEIDMTAPILGFDPMYVIPFGVVACTGEMVPDSLHIKWSTSAERICLYQVWVIWWAHP